MKLENYYLCVFESKNHAILLFTLLETGENNVYQLVSTPCGLKAGCTYSIKVPNKSYLRIVEREAAGANIKMPKIYYVDRIDGKVIYKLVDFK